MATTHNYRAFADDLDKFAKKINVDFETALKRVVLEAFTRIIKRSPVDTGRFRSSWTLAEGVPDVRVSPPGQTSYSVPSPTYSPRKPYQVVWIANSLPYAERLENGWSKQAPRGMVRLTAAELETFVRTAARFGA